MRKKVILFDLDGTLTDSGEGIMNCVEYAFEKMGMEVPERSRLRVFIGPPLRETFADFGVPQENVLEAIRLYRERYVPVGVWENHPYDGIEELLKGLKEDGCHLYVATSKPEFMAVQVLEKFGLSKYFDLIAGATTDEKRDTKDAVIRYLLEQTGEPEKALMIGDTKFDVLGAKETGMECIGCSWGYGTVQEMVDAGAVSIADTPEKLKEQIEAYWSH